MQGYSENVQSIRLTEALVTTKASVLAQRGDLEQAKSLLEPIVLSSRAAASTIDLLAKVYILQGNIQEATGLWSRAIKEDPDNTQYQRALHFCTMIDNYGMTQFLLSRLLGEKLFTVIRKDIVRFSEIFKTVVNFIKSYIRRFLTLIRTPKSYPSFIKRFAWHPRKR